MRCCRGFTKGTTCDRFAVTDQADDLKKKRNLIFLNKKDKNQVIRSFIKCATWV